MSVLSGRPYYKVKDTFFVDEKTKADIFMATKCLNCTLALKGLNYENLIIVIYNTFGEICTSILGEF